MISLTCRSGCSPGSALSLLPLLLLYGIQGIVLGKVNTSRQPPASRDPRGTQCASGKRGSSALPGGCFRVSPATALGAAWAREWGWQQTQVWGEAGAA